MTIKKVTYRKLKSVDLQSLNRDLATSALCNDAPRDQADLGPLELDALVRSYNTTLSKATDRHAPLKTKTMAVRPAVPWYNNKINTAKRLRRKAERIWRKTKLLSDLKTFKVKKNKNT